MKFYKYITLALNVSVAALLLASCAEDGDGIPVEEPSGAPAVRYIRMADPESSDSLLVSATLGTGIVVVGENLGATREVWFNDQRAALTPSWVTNRTIFVDVPSNAPANITNTLYIVNGSGDTLKHPFEVAIPAPVLASARNEWPQQGENLVIHGNYFFEPLTVTFTGGVTGEVVSVTQSRLEVTVPEGAVEGPVTVETNFGEEQSTFHVWDSRNIILDMDEKLGNGWRIGLRETGDGAINGNYLVFRGEIAANQRDEGPGAPQESPLLIEYWGGNDPNRNENFYPFYPNSYREYVLKFEAKVETWYGGHLNICLSTPDHTGNNQEVWSNTYNARALWAPWEAENEEFSTEESWITVVIPMTEFQYYMGSDDGGVFYTPNQRFVESAAGSLSMWLLGSPQSDGSLVEFYIDNIRIVQP